MAKAKLTAEQKLEILQKYNSGGYRQTKLAREYGVTQATIARIWGRWKDGKPMYGIGGSMARTARMRTIYPRLERWRMENGISQDIMANRAGIPLSTLRWVMYEDERMPRRGGCGPSKQTIDRLLKLTGLTYEEAFGE